MNKVLSKKFTKIFFLVLAATALFAVPFNKNLAFGYGSVLGVTTIQSTPIDLSGDITSVIGGNLGAQPLNSYDGGSLSNVDLTGLGIDQGVTLTSSSAGNPIIISNGSLPNASIVIPDNTTILAPASWDGFISPPSISTNAGNAPSGFSVGNTVVEVGSSTAVLLFDQPIDIILTGVTGSVGYRPTGSNTWIQITNVCGGSYASPATPAFPGECYISNGSDTKIHTFHLTSFAGLIANSSSGNSNSGNGGGGDGLARPPGAPTCNDQRPGNAPHLISAVVSGQNKVTLHWSEASNPVTYYLVTFGNKPGQQLYGNPNVGGKGTTSYTVSSLSSNQKYYFKVRAGNGCQPGDFSNEVAVIPAGAVLTGNVPAGFAQGVLGVNTVTPSASPSLGNGTESPSPTSEPTTQPSSSPVGSDNGGGFFQRLFNFFKHLFGG